MNNLEKYDNSMTFTNILYDISEIIVELDKQKSNKIKLTYLGNDTITTKSKIIKNNSKKGAHILQSLGYKNITDQDLIIICTKIMVNSCLFCKKDIYDLNIVDFRNSDNIIIHNYEIYQLTTFTVGYGPETIYTFNN